MLVSHAIMLLFQGILRIRAPPPDPVTANVEVLKLLARRDMKRWRRTESGETTLHKIYIIETSILYFHFP